MGEDPQNQDREIGGRFQASTTLDDVLRVFDDVRGPVVTSSDVAQACDCSAKTARRKLDELADQGRVEGRETAGRTVWWRVDDDGEIVTDGGQIFAVGGDPDDGVQLTPTDEEGAIHIHGIEDITGLETVMMTGNYPTKMVLRHVDTDDVMERGPLGEVKELGLYVEHLRAFLAECCKSDWPTTVDASVRDRVVEVLR